MKMCCTVYLRTAAINMHADGYQNNEEYEILGPAACVA